MSRSFSIWLIVILLGHIAAAGELQRAEAVALLGKINKTLPKGWVAVLYWDDKDPGFQRPSLSRDWFPDEWRDWLPGLDGRRIVVRRKEAVTMSETSSGPDRQATYIRTDSVRPGFDLTIGEYRKPEEIRRRLAGLDVRLQELETTLKPSLLSRKYYDYVQHSVPRDDQGKHALEEYERLWTIKRWFPQ